MTEQELREQMASRKFDEDEWVWYSANRDNLNAKAQARWNLAFSYADSILSDIYSLFGGKDNFWAILAKLKETEGDCPKCIKGQVIADFPYEVEVPCEACKGTGKVLHPERIVIKK